jgi:putative ABC transport system permease protein
MGRILLVRRLAARDLRRRPAQAVLLLIVITAAMATLTLGLILHGVTSKPYGQTRAATAGPDVVASSVGFTGSTGTSASALGRFAALAHAPGVTAHSGPYPVAWPVLRAHGITADVMTEGRDDAPAAVDQPKVIHGSWVRAGGVVVERAFADALGVQIGDHVTLDGRPFQVTGIAVTAAVPVYSQVCFYGGCSGPGGQPGSFGTGLVWLTAAAARSLATPGNPLTYYLNLRLRDPAAAPAFVSEHQPPPTSGPPALTAWQSLREAAATLVVQEQQILVPASWLLGLLAVASVAVVAGGRMAEQEKRVGLLKAAGGTPSLAAAVLLAEHLLVALAAAAAGLAAGWLAAPLLTSPGASLVGSPGPPSLTWSTVLLVAAAAVAVGVASTLVPALRAARISTVAALAGAARPPRRRAALIKFSAWLPVPLLLALRLVTRRPRRALLSAASLAVTATTIVAVLIYHATVSLDSRRSGPFSGPPDPGQGRVSEVLLVITVVMVILAAADTIFTTWATVLDARRFSAITRSLGATPQQTVAGLSAAQLLPALAGALLGIPAGTALYAAVQNGGAQGSPPAWWLLAMVLGMLLAVAGLTAIPARIGARRPVAEILQSETA